ncbi:hypothetical protein [Algoriphagus resistens]|uniref:hypothetical protein n=1 Tax=Algoriphagus resistens TaxID=1750590 RepID=UPI000A5AF6DF|nr:hypothetical protein [Algoriphagus resistens]
MKILLRIYLVLILASSAMDAGSVNDSINSGFPVEASNFVSNPGYHQDLKEIAACISSSIEHEHKTIEGAKTGGSSEGMPAKRKSK